MINVLCSKSNLAPHFQGHTLALQQAVTKTAQILIPSNYPSLKITKRWEVLGYPGPLSDDLLAMFLVQCLQVATETTATTEVLSLSIFYVSRFGGADLLMSETKLGQPGKSRKLSQSQLVHLLLSNKSKSGRNRTCKACNECKCPAQAFQLQMRTKKSAAVSLLQTYCLRMLGGSSESTMKSMNQQKKTVGSKRGSWNTGWRLQWVIYVWFASKVR